MKNKYLMEHSGEGSRLELKTREEPVLRQASWAGISEGMHILDAGCGVGKTTSILKDLVGSQGTVTGLDGSAGRLEEARNSYQREGLNFVQHDLRTPYLVDRQYDAIWMRFVLEYFRDSPLDIVKNIVCSLKPGGILVLADLDQNSLTHYGHSNRLDKTIQEILGCLEENHNFDPYAGRKLYAHMIDLGYQDIAVTAEPHHLIYGAIDHRDAFNWMSKVEVAAQKSGASFKEYDGDFQAARDEFQQFLEDPRRFIFTPVILCRGVKP